jgi:hypothetical protein
MGGSSPENGASGSQRWTRRARALIAVPVLLVLVGAAVYAVGDAILAPRPVPKSPGFVDTVLASRAVVAAIRVAIIFASCFIVASVIALIGKGEWLTRVGPVQVSDVSKINAENQRLKSVT